MRVNFYWSLLLPISSTYYYSDSLLHAPTLPNRQATSFPVTCHFTSHVSDKWRATATNYHLQPSSALSSRCVHTLLSVILRWQSLHSFPRAQILKFYCSCPPESKVFSYDSANPCITHRRSQTCLCKILHPVYLRQSWKCHLLHILWLHWLWKSFLIQSNRKRSMSRYRSGKLLVKGP